MARPALEVADIASLSPGSTLNGHSDIKLHRCRSCTDHVEDTAIRGERKRTDIALGYKISDLFVPLRLHDTF